MKLSRAFDAHVHLRQGELLKSVAQHTDRVCSGCLVMPNVIPRVDNPQRLTEYAAEVRKQLHRCTPLFAFELTPASAKVLPELRSDGAVAGKLYPRGVTHNSDGGPTWDDLLSGKFDGAMRYMASLGMPLCVHGEMPGACCLDAEEEFLPLLDRMQRTGVKLVLEHISTAAAVRRVIASGMHATITAHHLELTVDDALRDIHCYCKPVPKRAADREALLNAVSLPEVFLGSDSAPHRIADKRRGAPGVFSAPLLVEQLADTFDSYGMLGELAGFCTRGAAFYGHQLSGELELQQMESVVADGDPKPWRTEVGWRVTCA